MGLDDVGGAYLKTQQALGEICVQNRPIQGLFLPIFCFRQLPSSSVVVRFRSVPTCLAPGNISVGLDDVGRAYLKTQQALGEICVQNRPIQGMFLPIFCFRQLPSASVRRRHLLEPQLASASGRAFWRCMCVRVWGNAEVPTFHIYPRDILVLGMLEASTDSNAASPAQLLSPVRASLPYMR